MEKYREFLRNLDEKSKKIARYIWKAKYAKIGDLREAAGLKTDMHTLDRIKNVINPKSKEIFGKPCLKFEKSRRDHSTGEKILFSWWSDQRPKELKQPLIDVFDEKKIVRVTAEVPKNSNAFIDNGKLYLSTGTNDFSIKLPAGSKRIRSKNYKNGILEIIMEKINGKEKETA